MQLALNFFPILVRKYTAVLNTSLQCEPQQFVFIGYSATWLMRFISYTCPYSSNSKGRNSRKLTPLYKQYNAFSPAFWIRPSQILFNHGESFLTKQEMWEKKKQAMINNNVTSPREVSKKGFDQILIQQEKNTMGFSAAKKFLQPIRSLNVIRGTASCYNKSGKKTVVKDIWAEDEILDLF